MCLYFCPPWPLNGHVCMQAQRIMWHNSKSCFSVFVGSQLLYGRFLQTQSNSFQASFNVAALITSLRFSTGSVQLWTDAKLLVTPLWISRTCSLLHLTRSGGPESPKKVVVGWTVAAPHMGHSASVLTDERLVLGGGSLVFAEQARRYLQCLSPGIIYCKAEWIILLLMGALHLLKTVSARKRRSAEMEGRKKRKPPL